MATRSQQIASLLITLFSWGCAGNPVKMDRVALTDLVTAHRASAYDGGPPSDRTLALVDLIGISTEDHPAAIDALGTTIEGIGDRSRLLARSELLFARGDAEPSAGHAARYHLAAAFDALQALRIPFDGDVQAVDPERHRAIEAYGYALTRFLSACTEQSPTLPQTLRRLRGEFELDVVCEHGPWQLDDFDRWICADTLQFEGLRHRYRRPGAGVPLVMQRDPARGIPPPLTPESITRAATAVLMPADTPGARAKLRILEPRTARTVDIAEVSVPLAADFTAPFGLLLAQANLHTIENRSFFQSDAAGHEGLFLLEDYDPSRRPLVMVHGLWSSPLTWRDLTNDVFGDETLHRRYQVWHYFYATGVPLLENARLLRNELRWIRRHLDPEHDDIATSELVLIGHSMGGLLSRMALQSTGDAVWNTLFEGSIDDLDLEPDDLQFARDLYFWESIPFVKRVIFIAAPHRGSALSDSLIGRLGSALMVVPERLIRLVDRIRGKAKVRVEVPTSVDELSGSHPVMQTLNQLPIREDVIYHSIMGDLSESDDPAEWTDGIVPYLSSTLADAVSELVIRGGDHSVHFDPRASAEVRRILRAPTRN